MAFLNDQWESYKNEVLPDNASEIQLEETRRAFFAGAVVVFGAMMGNQLNTHDIMTSMEKMDEIESDLKEFHAGMYRQADALLRQITGRGIRFPRNL
jgi:hypothetical protein